jgi:superfamily II DNA or RNA helicase
VLLSTGKLVGEGFDHPPLDTLVLAMPISWKGTLQQYAGRLHREHANKTSVRIVDFVDAGHPALLRMWDRRQRGYQAMGYRIPVAPVSDNLDFNVAPDDTEAAITEAGMKAGTK